MSHPLHQTRHTTPGAWDDPNQSNTKARHESDGPRMKSDLLLVATLVTCLTKQFAVLLLRHALAALLDDRAHECPLRSSLNKWAVLSCCAEFVTKYCVDLRRYREAHNRHECCRHELCTTPSIPRQRTAHTSPIPNSGSSGVDERGPQVVVNGTLRDPEGATDPNSGKLITVNQAIHRHLRHTHDQRDLGDCGEPYVGQPIFLSHRAPHVLQGSTSCRHPVRQTSTYLQDSE